MISHQPNAAIARADTLPHPSRRRWHRLGRHGDDVNVGRPRLQTALVRARERRRSIRLACPGLRGQPFAVEAAREPGQLHADVPRPPPVACCRKRRSEKPSPWSVLLQFSEQTERKTRRLCPEVCPNTCAQTRGRRPYKVPLWLHLASKATVETAVASNGSPSTFSCKCPGHVYLRVRGEVAEWPKAAVC